MGTQLNFSTVYHPQIDGITERVNQVLEDRLHMYVMNQPTKWKDYLHLLEFAYNNGYQASLKIIPFEALYGRKCHVPLNYYEPKDKLMLGLYQFQEMEELVKRIKQNLKVAQDRQKSYEDLKRTYIKEFQVGEHVYVKVQPKKISLSLGSYSKFAPQLCVPFEILVRVGSIVYHLGLPAHIRIHNVFHVYVLKKYVHDPTHVIYWYVIQVKPEG